MSAFQTIRISWRGIGIRVDFHPSRWNGPCDHVELHSDNCVPLPVTETGYRSHFLPSGFVTAETLADQVIAWLDDQANTPEWRTHEEDSKQLSLF